MVSTAVLLLKPWRCFDSSQEALCRIARGVAMYVHSHVSEVDRCQATNPCENDAWTRLQAAHVLLVHPCMHSTHPTESLATSMREDSTSSMVGGQVLALLPIHSQSASQNSSPYALPNRRDAGIWSLKSQPITRWNHPNNHHRAPVSQQLASDCRMPVKYY